VGRRGLSTIHDTHAAQRFCLLSLYVICFGLVPAGARRWMLPLPAPNLLTHLWLFIYPPVSLHHHLFSRFRHITVSSQDSIRCRFVVRHCTRAPNDKLLHLAALLLLLCRRGIERIELGVNIECLGVLSFYYLILIIDRVRVASSAG